MIKAVLGTFLKYGAISSLLTALMIAEALARGTTM
jgi:hypothetical protein